MKGICYCIPMNKFRHTAYTLPHFANIYIEIPTSHSSENAQVSIGSGDCKRNFADIDQKI